MGYIIFFTTLIIAFLKPKVNLNIKEIEKWTLFYHYLPKR